MVLIKITFYSPHLVGIILKGNERTSFYSLAHFKTVLDLLGFQQKINRPAFPVRLNFAITPSGLEAGIHRGMFATSQVNRNGSNVLHHGNQVVCNKQIKVIPKNRAETRVDAKNKAKMQCFEVEGVGFIGLRQWADGFILWINMSVIKRKIQMP